MDTVKIYLDPATSMPECPRFDVVVAGVEKQLPRNIGKPNLAYYAAAVPHVDETTRDIAASIEASLQFQFSSGKPVSGQATEGLFSTLQSTWTYLPMTERDRIVSEGYNLIVGGQYYGRPVAVLGSRTGLGYDVHDVLAVMRILRDLCRQIRARGRSGDSEVAAQFNEAMACYVAQNFIAEESHRNASYLRMSVVPSADSAGLSGAISLWIEQPFSFDFAISPISVKVFGEHRGMEVTMPEVYADTMRALFPEQWLN